MKSSKPYLLSVWNEAQFCSLQIFYPGIDLLMPILISTIIRVKHSRNNVFWTHSYSVSIAFCFVLVFTQVAQNGPQTHHVAKDEL